MSEKPENRSAISRVLLDYLQSLPLHYPELSEDEKNALSDYRKQLELELNGNGK